MAGRGAGSAGRVGPAGGSTREEWRTDLLSVIQPNWVDVRTSQCCPEPSSQESDGVTVWPSRADGWAADDAGRPAGSEIRRSCTCRADRDGICAGGCEGLPAGIQASLSARWSPGIAAACASEVDDDLAAGVAVPHVLDRLGGLA